MQTVVYRWVCAFGEEDLVSKKDNAHIHKFEDSWKPTGTKPSNTKMGALLEKLATFKMQIMSCRFSAPAGNKHIRE